MKKSKSAQIKQKELLQTWIEYQLQHESLREDLMSDKDLELQSQALLSDLLETMKDENFGDFNNSRYDQLKETLKEISISRAYAGFSFKETGIFVLTLRGAFFTVLQKVYQEDMKGLYEYTSKVNRLIDEMSLFAFETYLKGREEVILRQRDEIEEISTPIIRVWEGVLAVPLIGTLDSSRTQIIMESLLNEIVNTGSSIAILDISGVPTVDSLVAQHLIKTVSATRLMGAECIICGIRPEIAQIMVHQGIDLMDIVTKSTLASALTHAFRLKKIRLVKATN